MHQNQLISSVTTEMMLKKTDFVPLVFIIQFSRYDSYMKLKMILLLNHDLHTTTSMRIVHLKNICIYALLHCHGELLQIGTTFIHLSKCFKITPLL